MLPAFLLVLFSVPPGSVRASEFSEIRLGPVRIHPALGFEERFDNNIFLQATNEDWDFLSRLTGRLDLRTWRAEPARPRLVPPPGDSVWLTQSQTEIMNQIESVLVFPSDLATFYTARGGAEEEKPREGTSAFLLDVGYQVDGWIFARQSDLDTVNQTFTGIAAVRLASGVAITLAEEYLDRTTSTGDPEQFVSYAAGLRSIGVDFDQNATDLKLSILVGNRTFVTPEYLFFLARVLTDPFEPLGYQFHRVGLSIAHSFPPRLELSILYQAGFIRGEADKASLRATGIVPVIVPIPFNEDPRNGTFHQVLASAGYSLSPRIRVEAQAGAQIRDFQEDLFTSYVDAVVNADARYRLAERTSFAVRFSREPVDIASADGTFLTRTGGELSATQELAEKISLEVKGYYHHDVFDEQSALRKRGREDDAFGFQAGAQYDIQPWLKAGASYFFSDRTSNVGSEDTMDHRASLFVLLVR